MTQLIDKAAVVAEIEKRRDASLMRQQNLEAIGQETVLNEMVAFELNRIISFLDTIDVKEVDLEKEINDYFNAWQNVLCDEYCCNEGGFCCVLDENVKIVNIERCRKVAKHFFELGLKSQQGIKAED